MNDTIAPLTVRHAYAAPPARVFEAWVAPAIASRWLFATPAGRIIRCDLDPRPGGALVITDRRAGDDVEHRGEYVDVDPPRRLVFTFSVPKYSSVVTTVTIDIVPAGTGCELTLVHEGVLPEWASQTEQGWRDLLARLEQAVGG
jgi:uncharacterized protein YndB with AHSA1/START domain